MTYEGDLCSASTAKCIFYGKEHAYLAIHLSGTDGNDVDVVIRSEATENPKDVAAGVGMGAQEVFRTTLPWSGEYSATVIGSGATCPKFTLSIDEVINGYY